MRNKVLKGHWLLSKILVTTTSLRYVLQIYHQIHQFVAPQPQFIISFTSLWLLSLNLSSVSSVCGSSAPIYHQFHLFVALQPQFIISFNSLWLLILNLSSVSSVCGSSAPIYHQFHLFVALQPQFIISFNSLWLLILNLSSVSSVCGSSASYYPFWPRLRSRAPCQCSMTLFRLSSALNGDSRIILNRSFSAVLYSFWCFIIVTNKTTLHGLVWISI